MSDPTFARPLKELGNPQVTGTIKNTVEPAAGQGLTLDETSLVPAAVLGTGAASSATILFGDRTWGTAAGAPTGAAGGVLSGSYPNPGFAADMATQAELDAHTSDASAAHAASAVSYAGGTGMSATDVEAALDELATEKANAADVATDAELASHVAAADPHTGYRLESAAIAVGDLAFDPATQAELDSEATTRGAADTALDGRLDVIEAVDYATQAELDAHTGDATDAHDASAVSVVSTTLVGTGVDAQAVFEELDNAIVAAESSVATHLADAVDAHAGTAITNTAAGGISATTAQGAINELDTEKANLASPTFTGTPAAPTAAPGTNTTQLATTAFTKAAADAKVANAINNGTTDVAPAQDAVFDALALKAPIASPTLTGVPLSTTPTTSESSTKIATTAYTVATILDLITGGPGHEFDGHLNAEGVDLVAGTTDTPPDDRKVRWLRESDDAPLAELSGYEAATVDTLRLGGLFGSGSTKSTVRLASYDSVDTERAVLSTAYTPGAAAGSRETVAVLTSTGPSSAILLNDLGQSDFAFDADLDAHIADATDAHDASAISYVGGTGMSATEVESAIDELATEKLNTTAKAADSELLDGLNSDAYQQLVTPGFWKEDIQSVSVDIPSTAAHTGTTMNVTVTAKVGDYVSIVGWGNSAAALRAFSLYILNPIATLNTVVLNYYNTSAGTLDPAAQNLIMRVTHLS